MKCKGLATVLFLSFFLVSGAYAQNTYYLPQVANGSYGGGTYKTSFVLFNNTGTAATATINLTNDSGGPFIVTINSVTSSSFTVNLPAGASQILQTDGTGSVAAGAATVTSTSSIGVSAIFSIFDTTGHYVTETGVGNSVPQTDFVMPVDSTGFFNTGLALFNSSGGLAVVTMTLRDTTGAQVGSPLVLPPLANSAHSAAFVAGAGQLFPSVASFRGTLLVHSTAAIAAVTLRQYTNSPKLTYTSLPVVPTSTTKTTLNLAQVADGGGFQTSFLIFNMSSSTVANVSLALTANDGSPFSVTIPGYGTHSTFSGINLNPGASIFLQTDGSPGSPTAGAATITSNVPIGASGIFTVLSAGVFQTETGVGDSPVLTSFTLPIDITGNFNTGVAFFNTSSTTTASLTFRVYDATGAQVGSDLPQNILAKNHLALFVNQLFPSLSNFRGTLAITSTLGVAAVTLRQNSSPLSYTTLPVVSGTYAGSGTTTGSALLTKTDTVPTATSNVVLNEVLPSGFKLTGTVSGGPGTASTVLAISGQTGYGGAVNSTTGAYTIVLPAGTYNLRVSFTPSGVPTSGSVLVTSPVLATVQVSADTTQNLTFTGVTVFNVSGIVNGLSNLVSPTSEDIGFATSDGSIEGSFTLAADGSYQGVLPAGTYAASLSASISFPPSLFQSQSLGIYNLGSATISGNTVIPAFTVPATARLSGTVHGVALPGFGIGVGAIGPSTSVSSSASADFTTAQYQMILPKNVTYAVSVSVSLIQGTTFIGSLSYPIPANSLNFTADTANYDFTIPALPVYVTISGQVTDSHGNPVSNVSISASSQTITGFTTPALGFSTFAQTDASGNYSMSVLSGTNYSLFFIPPPPS